MTAYSPTQDGYLDRGQWPPLNGQFDWSETSDVNRIMGQEGPSGLIFDLPVATYTSLQLVVSGTLPASSSSLDPTLLLYMVSAANPPLWSQTNLPAHEAGPLVSSLPITDAGLYVWTFVLDMGVVGPIMALPGWTGRIALVLSLNDNIPARAFASSRHADATIRPFLEATAAAPSVWPCRCQVFILRNYQLLVGAAPVTNLGAAPARDD